jgi:hypothetical protein|tara:strand:+ start:757 stop:1239 length:483 start_codon:yes stop_codon:yes gene_type:complete
MATEKLKFKLELYATMWDKPPHAEILIGDKSHFTGDITGTEDKPNVIEFEHELTEGEDNELIIKRSGKDKGQSVVNDKGDILKDQLLHIKSMEIDEIDLGALVYEGVYTPEYPEPWATQQRESGAKLQESFKNVTAMGHNGTWQFKFTSPFYMWLLENLY